MDPEKLQRQRENVMSIRDSLPPFQYALDEEEKAIDQGVRL